MSGLSLHGFLLANRAEILERSRSKLGLRAVPTATKSELADGLPRFLDQLILVLGAKDGDLTARPGSVAVSASIHGEELLRRGLTVGQVVQDYGSICQSVTEVASERHTAITAKEFQTFNQCLDEAIAQAVTGYEHQRDQTDGGSGMALLGVLAHEMRNLLSASMLTFEVLSRGSVGINSNTGALLGRSLRRMRALIDRTLAQVRMEAAVQTSERVCVAQLIEEIEIVATIDAKAHDVHLSIEPGDHDVAVIGDQQILAAALANLVQNAFKFTRPQGHVTLRARATSDRVLIEVQDECGGLPAGKAEELFLPFEQRGADQTGLGLGLSISLKGVRASGGEIHVRDLPDHGCVFTVDLPRAPPAPHDDALSRVSVPRSARLAPGRSAELPDEPLLPSVLIAEDDEDILAGLSDLLSSRYRLTTVNDGAQALKELNGGAFDLAIVDLGLPIVDGLSVVQKFLGSGDRHGPAFLFLSGQTNSQVKAKALRLGTVDYMSKPFEPDELMARMARLVATVAREATLRADAVTDSLTGLANYRGFIQDLDREVERSRRYKLPLSLITLDLDHLKAINDGHGHDAGDDAIRLIAKVLTEGVRKFELVARQGGDEFAVILPSTGAVDARRLASRLHESIGRQTIWGVRLSASLGIASWDSFQGEGEKTERIEAKTLLKASDDALYQAKRAGRNRIESREV